MKADKTFVKDLSTLLPTARRASYGWRPVLAIGLLGLCCGGLWMGPIWYLWDQVAQARAIMDVTQHIQLTQGTIRQREKDFFLNSSTQPEFFKSGFSPHLQRHQEAVQRLHTALQKLKDLLPKDSQQQAQNIQQVVNHYEVAFEDLVAAYRHQGFKDWGLVGTWRQSVHSLESYIQALGNAELEIGLLRLRRAEKDYLLRKEDKYRPRVFDLLEQLRVQIEGSADGSSSTGVSLLSGYKLAFSSYLALAQKIGVTEQEGLRGVLDETFHSIFSAISEMNGQATWEEQQALAPLKTGLTLAGGLMVILLVLAIWFGQWGRLRARDFESLFQETALQAAESKSQMTAIDKVQAIIEFTLDGTVLTANENFLRMMGYTLEEVQGQHHRMFCELSYGESPEYQTFWAKLNRGEYDAGAYQRIGKRGEKVWVQATYNPIVDALGQPYKVVEFAMNVTSQKMLEETLKVREGELVDSMILTQGIVDMAVDGIIAIDEQGRIESFNRAARLVFGYSDNEVLGRNINMLMPSPYHEQHDQYLRRYQATGEKGIIGSSREVLGQRKDGSTLALELSVSEVHVGDRRVFMGIVRDISERKASERRLGQMYKDLGRKNEELIQARDQALEAVKMKSEFLAMMSHEIRTPMNGVLGMTGILLESNLDQDQRECAETVKHSAESLLTIINDILDFSKIESGKLEIEIIDFDLRVAVDEVLDLLGAKAQDKGLELVGLVYASVPTAVRGDPGRFRQILLNLVGNAIKFTHEGEVVVHIEPDWETPEEVALRIEVRDTGIGLSLEAGGRLFQPFSQADGSTTRKYGGTGLGLAICKQLVELMGGEIGVQSSPGHGSCFWFTARLEKQSQPTEPDQVAGNSLEGLRVCVVDANDTNRLLLIHYTTAWGMDCLNTNNGPGALALLHDAAVKGQPCDLLIFDMHMSTMDGLELARKVKADPVLANTRIVILTAMGRRGDGVLVQEAGISAYLTKPIHQYQLRDCLRMVMNPLAEGEAQLITKHSILEAKRRREGRLLVADDNIVNQKVAVRMLERLGYRVDVVANGSEAVAAVSRVPYDAVLMDCQMPEMDGYEATRAIRAREAEGRKRKTFSTSRFLAHLPIIAMTANAMQGDREICLNAGMDDFVSKPIKPEELEAVLDRWVSTRETETSEVSVGDHEIGVTHGEIQNATDEPPAISDPRRVPSDDPQDSPLDTATLDGLRELSGDDSSFLIEIIQQFLLDGPDHMAAIQLAVADTNADALMKAAHGFKGSCRNMGALPLGELCCTLEEKGGAGEPAHLEDVLPQLEREYSRVRNALQAELSSLSVASH